MGYINMHLMLQPTKLFPTIDERVRFAFWDSMLPLDATKWRVKAGLILMAPWPFHLYPVWPQDLDSAVDTLVFMRRQKGWAALSTCIAILFVAPVVYLHYYLSSINLILSVFCTISCMISAANLFLNSIRTHLLRHFDHIPNCSLKKRGV